MALYVPSEVRLAHSSKRFGCYLTVDSYSYNLGLDTDTASNLRIPTNGIGFSVITTAYPLQYGMIIVAMFAPLYENRGHEAIGTITVKFCSVESCDVEVFNGPGVVGQLKSICGSIEEASALPERIVKFTAACEHITVNIHNTVSEHFRLMRPDITEELARLKQATASPNKTISLIYPAGPSDIEYVKTLCQCVQEALPRNRNKTDRKYIFGRIFAKSPNVQQLHLQNAPLMDSAIYRTGLREPLGVMHTFDTPAEFMVTHILGGLCDFYQEIRHAD
ncbi:dcd68beb-8c87-4fbc-858e-b231a80f09c0 [Thermothielavioides terrestris]|uniref:Dcd68beb-8c87-4fbc-858e-b231a80f09c0 n=1 Tax=Thermothielavioides terrestris TaxID=2587410 RepID=A0A3S4F1A3_9PEZI|nr:dcd68beb-8c87-4fbc-858e-b231a80f09c0 [Thermothielavioides terrestris]